MQFIATVPKPKILFKNGAKMRPNQVEPTIELKHLVQNQGITFDLTFTEPVILELIKELDLLTLRKAKFTGTVLPLSKGDWELLGTLGATVEQPCSLTLEPVRTRIDAAVLRKFRRSPVKLSATGPDNEIPDDDSEEQLGETIDIIRVFSEALSLELPDYPRAENAEVASAEFGPPGVTPLTDDSIKPFAMLANLKDKLK
jgi:uncharacterized metal-binding protein YceD (DUF177 family)